MVVDGPFCYVPLGKSPPPLPSVLLSCDGCLRLSTAHFTAQSGGGRTPRDCGPLNKRPLPRSTLFFENHFSPLYLEGVGRPVEGKSPHRHWNNKME